MSFCVFSSMLTWCSSDSCCFLHYSFWVNGRLFFGMDRLHLVEQSLGNKDAQPLRLVGVPDDAAQRPPQKLTVYFDFSSPWTFLGVSQVLACSVSLKVFFLTQKPSTTSIFSLMHCFREGVFLLLAIACF